MMLPKLKFYKVLDKRRWPRLRELAIPITELTLHPQPRRTLETMKMEWSSHDLHKILLQQHSFDHQGTQTRGTQIQIPGRASLNATSKTSGKDHHPSSGLNPINSKAQNEKVLAMSTWIGHTHLWSQKRNSLCTIATTLETITIEFWSHLFQILLQQLHTVYTIKKPLKHVAPKFKFLAGPHMTQLPRQAANTNTPVQEWILANNLRSATKRKACTDTNLEVERMQPRLERWERSHEMNAIKQQQQGKGDGDGVKQSTKETWHLVKCIITAGRRRSTTMQAAPLHDLSLSTHSRPLSSPIPSWPPNPIEGLDQSRSGTEGNGKGTRGAWGGNDGSYLRARFH